MTCRHEAALESEAIEKYCRGLQWDATTSEEIRSRVVMNIRGFASHLRSLLEEPAQQERETFEERIRRIAKETGDAKAIEFAEKLLASSFTQAKWVGLEPAGGPGSAGVTRGEAGMTFETTGLPIGSGCMDCRFYGCPNDEPDVPNRRKHRHCDCHGKLPAPLPPPPATGDKS